MTRGGRSCSGLIVEELDALPFITKARDFRPWLDLVRDTGRGRATIPLEATRGCPLQCSFCSTRQVWGARVRRKSPSRLLEEMKQLSAICGGQTFFNLIGDNVGVPRGPFMAFCEEFAEINTGCTWGCSLKLDRLEQPHLERMWAAGARAMFIGLESGNQTTLDNVRKKTNIAKELANLRAAIDLGFRVDTSFIVGFPWEMMDDIKKTFLLHNELLAMGANRSQIGVLCPIPGTDIVKGGQIAYDEESMHMVDGDVFETSRLKEYIAQHPALFTHLGYYETPLVARTRVLAVRDAAAHTDAMHRKRNRNDWNSFEPPAPRRAIDGRRSAQC